MAEIWCGCQLLWLYFTLAVSLHSITVQTQLPPQQKPENLAQKEEFTVENILLNQATPRQIYSDALLSEETLKQLADKLRVNPCTSWKLKRRFTSGHDLGVDESKLSEFIEFPRGERLVQKLYKVLKGEDVFLSVMGGSNCGGAGVQEDEGGAEGLFPLVITDWWKKTITPVTGSEIHLNLVSIGGTGSDFYQYCHHAYLEDSLDLVLLESSVNDVKIEHLNKVNRSLALEQLTRQLLSYPSKPALIYLNLYHGNYHFSGCKNLEDYGQRSLSQAYNITSIKWRDLVCPLTPGDVREPMDGILTHDKIHINLRGHAQVSLMLINLFRGILLDIISTKGIWQAPDIPLPNSLPKPVYIKSTNKIISKPLCWTTMAPNYKKPIKNDFNITVVKNTQFKYWPSIRMGYPCDPSCVCRTDAFSGWIGTTPGATMIISFTVPHLAPRSVVFTTKSCGICGKAKVWIDNDFENGKIIKGKDLHNSQTSVNVIALNVNPGLHTLTINVLESGNVTLAGVMFGPQEGAYL